MADVAVILGAGASHDVSNGSGDGSKVWLPPLTDQLFGDRARNHFSDVMEKYPGARLLFDELFPMAIKGALDLERQLSAYAGHRNARIRQAFKHIPPYLFDVFHRSSRSFDRDSGTYSQMILQLLAHNDNQVVFVVMNYDTLLERALQKFDPSYKFSSLNDYGADRPAMVFKPHGSINWASPLGPTRGDWFEQVEMAEIAQLTQNIDVLPDGPFDSFIRDRGDHNSHWYPVLTLPLLEKSADDMVWPALHRNTTARRLSSCTRVLIAGTRGQDSDVLELLRDHLPTVGMAHLVAKGDGAEVYERVTRAVPQLTMLQVFDSGLREYVDSSDFLKLAQDD